MSKATIRAAGVAATVSTAALLLSAIPSLAAGSLPVMKLALKGGKSVNVSGSRTAGAVEIVTTVTGEQEGEPTLVRLQPGVTAREFLHEITSLGNATPLDVIDPYGRIVFDGVDPTGTSRAEAMLAPGHYLATDLDASGRLPVTEFTVGRSAHPAALPKPDATVTAIDFGIRGASTLRDGELVRFQNDGYSIHMFLFAQAKSAAAAAQAEKLLLAGQPKQAKQYSTGVTGQFAGPLSSGAGQQELVSQPPGVYVLLCAMNEQDGRETYQLGMFRTIRIVK